MEKQINGFIGLKFGLVKLYHFEDEFYITNKELCDKFIKLDEKMFSNCCDMFSASNKNKDNSEIKNQLCNNIDLFFDLGIKVYNDFDNKTYKTKKSYRKYILGYNLN